MSSGSTSASSTSGSAYDVTKKRLTEIIKEGDEILTEKSYLESVLEGKKRDFIATREAGITGELQNKTIPTIQDLAIYLFWISYTILFYIIGTSKAFLEGWSRYLFIGVTVLTFVLQFYNWRAAAGILAVALVYFAANNIKNLLFFLTFLITSIFIHAVISSYF